jgi:hypothetical protein
MSKEFQIQVDALHYKENYDDLNRFISYFHQINLIKKTGSKNILEVGVGNKTVLSYLKNQGYNVTSCDFDKSLNPDYIADLRKLPFRENSFDCVVAYEILEHLPFSDFSKSISQLHFVSSKYVLISVPYSSIFFEFIFRFPFVDKIFKKSLGYIRLSVPFYSHKFLGDEHYWELGRKGYSLSKIKKKLRKYFQILKIYRPPLCPHHCFFVLKKR